MQRMIDEIAKNSHLSKAEVALVFKAFKVKLLKRIKGRENFTLQGIGKLVTKEVPATEKYIPFDGTTRMIPAKLATTFQLTRPLRRFPMTEIENND